MCSLFIARPSSFISSSLLLPSLSFGLRYSDGSGLSTCDGGVCVGEAHRNMASGYSSRMNETPPPQALVCPECVREKRWWRRNKDLSRDLDSPDGETKRWRDKIERPRQKREGRRKTEREREGESETINVVCVLGWLVCSQRCTSSDTTPQISSRLSWFLEDVCTELPVFHRPKLSPFKNVLHCR